MTKEEAIAYLKSADVTVGREIKTRTAEALEMTIKALEQEPVVYTVSFDRGLKDESVFCVTRICGCKTTVLKTGFGEEADSLYHFLTKQMAKEQSNGTD